MDTIDKAFFYLFASIFGIGAVFIGSILFYLFWLVLSGQYFQAIHNVTL